MTKRGYRGHNSRMMKSAVHGKKYTRVMKEENGYDVDAGLVKREEEEEEENKYLYVMRKAEDTFSRAATEDPDGKILTQRAEGNNDGNVFEMMLVKKEFDQMETIEEAWATKSRGMRKEEEKKFQRVRRNDDYVRGMRRNQNLFLRPTVKRFLRPTMKRFLRPTMKKEDEVSFTRGMLTRVG